MNSIEVRKSSGAFVSTRSDSDAGSQNEPDGHLTQLPESGAPITPASVAIAPGTDDPHLGPTIVVYRDGRPVSRCAVYDHPGVLHEGLPALQLGHFESLDDAKACAALADAVMEEARARNKAWLIGPMDGSTWERYRLPLDPQPNPFLSEMVYPTYYPRLFEAIGFRAIHHYGTWQSSTALHSASTSGVEALTDAGVRLRTLSEEGWVEDLAQLYPVCSAAFAQAPLYTPLSEEEFISHYLGYAPLVRAGYSLLAEDARGNAVAFLFAFPDAYDASRMVIKTVAKHPACTVKGLITAMTTEAMRRAANDERTTALHAFIHEENKRSLARSKDFGGRLFRRYALYAKKVAA